jgi:hypothetical protein
VLPPRSAFKDEWLDPRTGKTGILYYMYEEWEFQKVAGELAERI